MQIRERLLDQCPELPEGFEDVWDFYLTLSNYRRYHQGVPQPFTLSDVSALLSVAAPESLDENELFPILRAMDVRELKIWQERHPEKGK